MPIMLPTFEDGYGLSCCVCGEIEAASALPNQQKSQVSQYDTPQGQILLRAWIESKLKRSLYVNWAKSACFEKESLPKVTTENVQDVLRIVESASNLTVKATVCASFRVPITELPEVGIIRPLLSEGKGARVSIQMTGASFTLTGLPTSRLKWYVVGSKDARSVHVDLKGSRQFKISETYLSDVWRWINEQFTVLVLGRGKTGPDSDPE